MVLELKSLGLHNDGCFKFGRCGPQSRGKAEVDEQALSQELGVPVVKTIAIKRGANQQLLDLITEYAVTHDGQSRSVRFAQVATDSQHLYQQADEIISRTVSIPHSLPRWHERLDYWALHPIVGGNFIIFNPICDLPSGLRLGHANERSVYRGFSGHYRGVSSQFTS